MDPKVVLLDDPLQSAQKALDDVAETFRLLDRVRDPNALLEWVLSFGYEAFILAIGGYVERNFGPDLTNQTLRSLLQHESRKVRELGVRLVRMRRPTNSR